MIHHLLFNERVNIQRRAYLWNMFSSLFYSIQSALFLLIATRVAGEAEAGGFILLFTVGIQFFHVFHNQGDYLCADDDPGCCVLPVEAIIGRVHNCNDLSGGIPDD